MTLASGLKEQLIVCEKLVTVTGPPISFHSDGNKRSRNHRVAGGPTTQPIAATAVARKIVRKLN